MRPCNRQTLAALIAVAVAVALSGCGGGSSTSGPMSAAQAGAVSGQVVQSLTAALESAFSGGIPASAEAPAHAQRSLNHALSNLHPASSAGDCTPNGTGSTCNIPISYTGTCSAGGAIAISGDISGTLDSSGTGTFAANITVTPTNCAVTGTTVSGDPNIVISGQVSLTDNTVSYPFTFTEGGGLSYGPKPSGTCQVSVNYSFSSSQSCTVTGTLCGQAVNASCSQQ